MPLQDLKDLQSILSIVKGAFPETVVSGTYDSFEKLKMYYSTIVQRNSYFEN